MANSGSGFRRSEIEEYQVTQRGSVHAGFKHVRCLSCVPERHSEKRPDTGRDGRVTTQVATQGAAPFAALVVPIVSTVIVPRAATVGRATASGRFRTQAHWHSQSEGLSPVGLSCLRGGSNEGSGTFFSRYEGKNFGDFGA